MHWGYPARKTAKDFFDAIKARCCPGNCFQKLKVVCDLLGVLIENGAGHPQPNTTLILTLCRTFAMFKKLGVDTNELEGLLAQAVCHAPPDLGQVVFNQLVTAAILAKGNKKPFSTFIGQVIMNALQKNTDSNQRSSPFIYCVSEPLTPTIHLPRPHSPFLSRSFMQAEDVHRPPEHLVDRFGGSCFHCGRTGHWELTAHILGVLLTQTHGLLLLGPCVQYARGCLSAIPTLYQQERVSQVLFVKRNTSDRVLIDTGESIHMSGSHCFATDIQDIPPFCIFFADSNSSVAISQTTTFKLPVKNSFVIICDIPFTQKILGTILSVGRLCRAGVIPFFNGLSLSLLVTTTFVKDCWWMDVVRGGRPI
ncbi:hypothetical protein O181_096829, partial [Austropuccinia psidii MF-1]|nr:hypothetical protein [Austropuccinia psidii MF-1]